jgi:hypothetical protein
MLHSLNPADRKLLLLTGALFVAVCGAGSFLATPPETRYVPFPSSYSARGWGAKAAYDLLVELGYHTERWMRPPTDLNAPEQEASRWERRVLVLAEPVFPASADEQFALRRFVSSGGRVLATGAAAASLLDLGETALAEPARLPHEFSAEAPSPLTRQTPRIAMRSWTRLRNLRSGEQRYYGDAAGATVIKASLGRGEVIWWADSLPLTNGGLSLSSNLMLYLNSIGPPQGARILWDEYYHGERLDLGSYLGHTPIPWMAVQLGLLLAAAWLAIGRPLGPRLALSPPSRLSPLEFVESLGDLYQRKGAASAALEVVYQRFRRMLGRRLGLPATATVAQLSRGVREKIGWTVPGFWETLQRCERGVRNPDLTGQEALGLIQELHDYTRRFRLE